MTKSNKKINVQDKIISIVSQNDQDYISLTDMVKTEDGEDHIRNWMRNRNTVEFIGLWETLHNPDLNLSNSTPLENRRDLIVLT